MRLIPNLHQDASMPDDVLVRIKNVITRAEAEVANGILRITEDVTIIIDTDLNMIDPNIGVGGYTNDKNNIQFSVDPTRRDLRDDEILPRSYTSLVM